MYLAFTRLPGESYRRRLRSLLLYLCYVFRALINSLACGFWKLYYAHCLSTYRYLKLVRRRTSRRPPYCNSTAWSETATDTPRCPSGRPCRWRACGRSRVHRTSSVPWRDPAAACTWAPCPGWRAEGSATYPSCAFPGACKKAERRQLAVLSTKDSRCLVLGCVLTRWHRLEHQGYIKMWLRFCIVI